MRTHLPPPSSAAAAFLALMLAVATAMPLILVHQALSWHDQQRLLQILLILAATLALAFSSGHARPIGRMARLTLLGVLALGLASTAFAQMPLWSLTEISLLTGTLAIALAVRRLHAAVPSADAWLMLAAACLCLGAIFKYLLAYAAAISDPGAVFPVYELVGGFSHPRFLGQLATLLIPLLLAGVFFAADAWPRRYAAALWLLAALLWLAVISTGTRGTWLALGLSASVLVLLGVAGRRLALLILSSAMTGLVLTYLLFTVVPDRLGIVSMNHPVERLTTSLSGRDVAWSMSARMIMENPMLGVGPMHFAAEPNVVAAHPHNAPLQLAAEWGIPATVLLMLLAASAAWRMLNTIRLSRPLENPEDGLRIALFASLTGAAVQAMVDGMIVIPTTMVWAALSIGWAWALQPPLVSSSAQLANPVHASGSAAGLIKHLAMLAPFVASAILLTVVAARDLPRIITTQQAEWASTELADLPRPRFWVRGFITP
ncbi:O-antigen ligase family protein [Thioalkalivibrio sulfidiphilus]|uniref:O-antigen ligase family protein n=1 Tax=Thioalkalivibrio sulfidiphilus TaxID=1033854 RepID=UPI003B39EA66